MKIGAVVSKICPGQIGPFIKSELKSKVLCEFSRNVLQNKRKTDFWYNFVPIRNKKVRNMAPGAHTLQRHNDNDNDDNNDNYNDNDNNNDNDKNSNATEFWAILLHTFKPNIGKIG